MSSQLASNFKALLRGLVLVLLLTAGLWLMDRVAQTTMAGKSAAAAHRADAAPASSAPQQTAQQTASPGTEPVPPSTAGESKATDQSAIEASPPPAATQASNGLSSELQKPEPLRPAPTAQGREVSPAPSSAQPAREPLDQPAGRSGLHFVTRADGRYIATEPILFSTAQAVIRPGSLPTLAKLAEFLKAQPGIRLVIVGYTDNLGQEENNARVSTERAAAVKEHLVSQGIDASRLEYKGMGSQNPIASNDSQMGRQANRRIEFLITSSK